jgi:NADH-quinone oxidoreductase subunit G
MPDFFINGKPVHAESGQTVLEAALANGHYIPYFCWHPKLSVHGNCRVCCVEVEDDKGGEGWLDISCNMPVTEGMRVLTDSEKVRARRKATLQFITLNHPVDCAICDKAGECMLQDAHYEYNGERSVSIDRKLHATKFFDLSPRIVLDNERCIQCSRCVRFTREISKSNSLALQFRGDHTLLRPVEDGSFDSDWYSDNVVDICPVGALLSKSFFYQSRVWYLKPTPSVCPGCARGCTVQLWHRKGEWALKALDPRRNERIERVTPLENDAVNGPWICNTGRDLARLLERARAEQPMLRGKPVAVATAVEAARELIAAARKPVALVSTWASNEELAAFRAALAPRFMSFSKPDQFARPGEPVEDDLLIRADKNPNRAAVAALYADAPQRLPDDADLVLVWGEGFDFGRLPPRARVIALNAWLAPENGHADVFFATSIQTERAGHYTNFEGVVSRFEPCFAKKPSVVDAEALFEALAVEEVAA